MAKCAKCNKGVTKKTPGLQCTKCSKWFHGSCASLSTDQLTALSSTDCVDWKCRNCATSFGAKPKRVSVILPDPEEEESDVEIPSHHNQDKLLIDIRQEVREMRQMVRDIIREEMQSTLKFYSNKIDDYEEKIKEYEMRVKLIENQCIHLNNTCKNLTLKNDVLEQKVNKMEQYHSINNLEICGVATKPNEDVKQIALSCCKQLNQKVEDIVQVHRKKVPSRPGSAQSKRVSADAPIIVSLRDGSRDYWLEASKTIELKAKDLGGEGDSKIFIRESLSPTTAFLLWKTKTELKEKALCMYVWCKNGSIMVRKAEGDKKIYYVRAVGDIEKIRKEIQK